MGFTTNICMFFSKIKAFGAGFLASKAGLSNSVFLASGSPTEIVDLSSVGGEIFASIASAIIGWVMKLVFFVCKFALNFIDFCELLVNKIAGISGAGSTYSVNADFQGNPIFSFLLNDKVLSAFGIMVGIGIALVIVFTIIAIVKSEYDSWSNNKPNTKEQVYRRSLKSLFLFFAAPIVLFIFVIFSNSILNSVNQAFKSANKTDVSLGGQVFVASSYEANKYRNYALAGTRIPILFDFEDPSSTNLATYTAEDLANAYKSWTNADKIFDSFAYREFSKMSDTVVYKNNKLYNSSDFAGFESFVSTGEQYYLMADFIDYAVTTSLEFYIKSLNDPDVDWDAVKSMIGLSMYYSIVNDHSFTVPYKNVSGVGNDVYYLLNYVNSTGYASTPLADALSVISQVLAVGDFSDNTFRTLERVEGFDNFVRWKVEKACDKMGTTDVNDDIIRDVFVITKYTYNTTTETIEKRDPILVVNKDAQYFRVTKMSDSEIEQADGKYTYTCDTTIESTKVERVSVDYVLKYDNGDTYQDGNGQTVTMPKDVFEPCYSVVSWPEKIFNDMSIIFADINIQNLIDAGTWANAYSTTDSITIPGEGGGSVSLPTVFISPIGLILSELLLGQIDIAEQNTSFGTLAFSSNYSDATIDALIKSIGGQYNYHALSGQVNYFVDLFNSMMSPVIDDIAYQESIDIANTGEESVRLAVYKQYLASLMVTDEFATYFSNLAYEIIKSNNAIYDIKQESGALKSFNDLSPESITTIDSVLGKLTSADYSKVFSALTNYKNGTNPYAQEEKTSHGIAYSVAGENNVVILNAQTINASKASSIESRKQSLENERTNIINNFPNLLTETSAKNNLERLNAIDSELFSLQKYYIIASFSSYVSELSSSSMTISVNGRYYTINPNMTSTELVEMVFGNQLLSIASEYYTDANSFLYVDPNYSGIVQMNGASVVPGSSFGLLYDFLKDFGDYSFMLNKSNFSSIDFNSIDLTSNDDFYAAMYDYVLNFVLPNFPELASEIGLVNLNNEILLENSKIAINNAVNSELGDSATETKRGVISYVVTNVQVAGSLLNITYTLNFYVEYVEDGITKTADFSLPSQIKNGISISTDKQSVSRTFLKYLGLDLTSGQTLKDFRLEAMQKIVALETRAGESESLLQARFLNLLYLLCSDYSSSGNISTSTYSKSLVKTLAGISNRPDIELVQLTYDVDFSSGTEDEAFGTVFIVCTYDKVKDSYIPFLVSTKKQRNVFSSKYVVNPYSSDALYFPVVAKGVIDKNGNPTAIKTVDDDVVFYRDDIYVVNTSRLGISVYFQSLEDVRVKSTWLSSIVNATTKLFSGKTLTQLLVENIPRLQADSNLNFAYGSNENKVASVSDGYFPMSYNFSALGIDFFYETENLNFIVLTAGTFFLATAIILAVWGLIKRIIDITVLFIVAPPVIAVMPLDGNDKAPRYLAWRDKLISSVLSVYGVVIGLNVFFLFVPFISNMEFFAEGSTGAKAILSLGIMKNVNGIDFINNIMSVVFLLVAITLIRSVPKMFATILNPTDKDKEQDIFSKGEATYSNVRSSIDSVKDHVSGQYALDKMSAIAGTAKSLVPGAAIAEKTIQKGKETVQNIAVKAAETYAKAHGVPPEVAKKAAQVLKDQMKEKEKIKKEKKNAEGKSLKERQSARKQRGD